MEATRLAQSIVAPMTWRAGHWGTTLAVYIPIVKKEAEEPTDDDEEEESTFLDSQAVHGSSSANQVNGQGC